MGREVREDIFLSNDAFTVSDGLLDLYEDYSRFLNKVGDPQAEQKATALVNDIFGRLELVDGGNRLDAASAAFAVAEFTDVEGNLTDDGVLTEEELAEYIDEHSDGDDDPDNDSANVRLARHLLSEFDEVEGGTPGLSLEELFAYIEENLPYSVTGEVKEDNRQSRLQGSYIMQSNQPLGHVAGNEGWTEADIAYVIEHADEIEAAGDVNGDGVVNALDAFAWFESQHIEHEQQGLEETKAGPF